MVDIKSTLTSISTSLTTEPILSAATQEPLKTFVADLLTFVDEKLADYTEQIAAVSGDCGVTTTTTTAAAAAAVWSADERAVTVLGSSLVSLATFSLVQAALAQLVPAVSRALVPGAGDSLARLLHSLASSVHTQVERVSSYIFGRDQLRSSRYLYRKQ